MKHILILGGYGNTGTLIAEYLLAHGSVVRLTLAGRNKQRALALAESLRHRFEGATVTGMALDAANSVALQAVFADVDLVLVASSTIEYTEIVARAAIQAGIDYMDTQLSTLRKLDILQTLAPEIERAGGCFITDAGFHPGVPAALVRYAGGHFDQLHKANVASLMRINWAARDYAASTAAEMVSEFAHYRPLVLQEGQWVAHNMRRMPRFDFGPPFGAVMCVPMALEEMMALPEMVPGLQESGFFVSGFNPVVDYLLLPLIFAGLKIAPQRSIAPLGSLLVWALKRFSRPPYRTILRLEAAGHRNGQAAEMTLELAHDDGYVLTAIPIVACLWQYLDGGLRRPGLFYQANLVEPSRFLADIQTLGLTCTIRGQSDQNISVGFV